MLTSVTAPVFSNWAAFFTWPSTAAYSTRVDCTSRSAAASTWKFSTAMPSKPMTEQARAPSTERTTSSSSGRKAIGRAPRLRLLAGDDLIPSGDAADTPVEQQALGPTVQRCGVAPVDVDGEAHLVRVHRDSSRDLPEDLEGDQQRLGAWAEGT